MILQTGLTGTVSHEITSSETAVSVGSGSLSVCATPFLCALMETAAVKVIEGCLPQGTTSVGSHISVDHKAPTLTGHTVTVQAVLQKAEGRKLVFSLTARDEAGEVATGTHIRYLVETGPFMVRAEIRYTS